MDTNDLTYNPNDAHSVIGFAVPKKIVSVIDSLAAKQFQTRSAWMRRKILETVQREAVE